MRVWGAIDLRDGAAVQLVGGRYDTERVRVADVNGLADRWSACFGGVHVIDLDAALGHGSNAVAIRSLAARVTRPLQLGGGIRDDDAVAGAFAAGASRAIVGTRALEDAAWRERIASLHPGRIVLAADRRDGAMLTRGWTAAAPLSLDDVLARVSALPLAALLVTDVAREGALLGIDAPAFEALARASVHPIVAAGGIASLDDLRALRDAGVAEAVVGMAAYTGAIDPEDVSHEFPVPEAEGAATR